MTAVQVIAILDQTVDWYRTLGVQQQAATEPSDLLILYDNRQTANQVMGLAIDIARVDAEMLGKQPTTTTADAGSGSAVSTQSLVQLQKKLDAQGVSIQAELDAARTRLSAAPKKAKGAAQAKLSELQGELDLVNTKKNILSTMTGFAGGTSGSGSGALKSQIDAMAVAIPATVAPTSGTSPAAGSSASTITPGFGIPGRVPSV